MKLYTKTGDRGDTGLFGGQRLRKDHLRIEAYGTIDELNSVLGLARAACAFNELTAILDTLQGWLFEVGADLATPPVAPDQADTPAGKAAASVKRTGSEHIDQAERMIDQVWTPLPEMHWFILPGGTELAARLHVARTVCRRAERLCVTLEAREPIGEHIAILLNRLSDLLFAMARRANQLAGVADIPWKG